MNAFELLRPGDAIGLAAPTHIDRYGRFILPLGLRAHLNANRQTLNFAPFPAHHSVPQEVPHA